MQAPTSPPIDKRRLKVNKNNTKGKNEKKVAAEDKTTKETESDLDEGLKETFPASDPVSINPGAD